MFDIHVNLNNSFPTDKMNGQTPPFSTHNRDISERVLPTPFPQVGDILTEEKDSESEQELIA